jgi:hypothetical protein
MKSPNKKPVTEISRTDDEELVGRILRAAEKAYELNVDIEKINNVMEGCYDYWRFMDEYEDKD